ncbi:MAG: hypothetical protein L3J43_05025 [Sulfurovum sp.]|nr:hypothetical protein [Sulfurovum sp.]
MNHFVTVYTSKCTETGVYYIINTSIHAWTYKIEVYKNEVLFDTIEVDCADTLKSEMHHQSFMEKYQEAHNEVRDKYCQAKKVYMQNNSAHLGSKRNKPFVEKKNVKNFKKNIIRIVIFGVIGYYLITKVVVNSDLYIDWVFSEKDERITYLEQIESIKGELEKECVLLAKNELSVKNIATKENCHDWCDKNIIKKEKCDLFLAYFYTKIDVSKTKQSSAKDRTIYEVFPKEDNIELKISKVLNIKVANKSTQEITVRLIEIILENSDYEEIVQFKGAKTSLYIKKYEDKSFNIFLEPTYYKQFKLGKYTGKLQFSVTQGNKIIGTIKKDFYFVIE